MSGFNLCVIRPPGFIPSSGFDEIRDSLAWALTALGHSVVLTENCFSAHDSRNILFGAELLNPSASSTKIPPDAILYNLEQPSHPSMPNVRLLAHDHTVWDYALPNVAQWRADGTDIHHVPIGYTPNLTRIPRAPVQDIDVLFHGWLTPRRAELLNRLQAAGLHVVAVERSYGGARDNLISRAKVCINIRHDGRPLFNILRCSFWLANSKCVVTETGEDDSDYAGVLSHALLWRHYDRLVEACVHLCHSPGEREGLEVLALRSIRKMDFLRPVARALGDPYTHRTLTERAYSAALADPDCDMRDFLPWLREHARGRILEIGVRNGVSTSAFLLGIAANGGHLSSFDVNDCGHLFPGHPDWAFYCVDSRDIGCQSGAFDMALIDGDHHRDGYAADLRLCYRAVRPGGLILSHDIHPQPGHDYAIALREEFFRFAAEKGMVTYELPGAFGMGVMVR